MTEKVTNPSRHWLLICVAMTSDHEVIVPLRERIHRILWRPHSHISRRRLTKVVMRSTDPGVREAFDRLLVMTEIALGDLVTTLQSKASSYLRRGYFEREITRILADEVAAEIDREIINAINQEVRRSCNAVDRFSHIKRQHGCPK